MKRTSALALLAAIAVWTAAGCSEGTRRDIKQVGEGLKDDVNEGARDLDRKVQDAVD